MADKITSWTIEPGGRGATYAHADGFTVYGHGVYGRYSVLAGQDLRRFEGHFPTLEAAKAAFPKATVIEGTSYTPVSLSHLPDDEDGYDGWADDDGLSDNDDWEYRSWVTSSSRTGIVERA